MEKPYVLVYLIEDYQEQGGGVYMNRHQTQEEMIAEINAQAVAWGDKFSILLSGLLSFEIEYEKVHHYMPLRECEL